jgi:hypothetical protein
LEPLANTKGAGAQMNGVVRIISIGISLIANLIPLYGVLYWQWDAFQLLMLYWTETVITPFWTIVGIARLPVGQLVIGCKTLVDLSVASRRSPAINSMTIAR